MDYAKFTSELHHQAVRFTRRLSSYDAYHHHHVGDSVLFDKFRDTLISICGIFIKKNRIGKVVFDLHLSDFVILTEWGGGGLNMIIMADGGEYFCFYFVFLIEFI